jgi:myo-inositol catabolism protein IolC
MKTIGYNQPLYVLPFDHRESFETKMFGWHGDLTAEQTAEIAAAKQVIYDGFQAAVVGGVPKRKAAILVDEQFGAAILGDAAKQGYTTACPAEKSGQEEFDFQYGADFARHIETIRPTFCKVLVRYNPEGDEELNRRQASRLRQLSDYLHSQSQSRFMFELLVPAEKAQLDRLQGDKAAYDLELRPQLMVQVIQQLQEAGVEPDVWKVEGLDRHEDCERIVAVAQRDGRNKVGCIILGRGENDEKVLDWLRIMQLGMIGLGRMGANMVRRLIKDGHQCVVFDRSPGSGEGFGQGQAPSAPSRSPTWSKTRQAARHLADGAGGGGGSNHRRPSCLCWKRVTRSLTAAIPITLMTSGARRNSRRKEFIMWMWAPAAACGDLNAVIA